MTNTSSPITEDRLLLHGVADMSALRMIGPRMADFAGTPVRAIKEGRVVALVSMAPRPVRLPRWLSRMIEATAPNLEPVASALTSLFPMLPVTPGTTFASEEALRQMMLARESEIAGLIADHAGFVECELQAGFDGAKAERDIASSGPIAAIQSETESERALVEQSLNQSVMGRRAAFLARLHRRIMDSVADAIPVAAGDDGEGIRRRLLIARQDRAQFRASLSSLLDDVGEGAWLRVGAFYPPKSFRRLEVSSADVARVDEARAALGLQETTERHAIRTAYERTIERLCARQAQDQPRQHLDRLESQFGLLNLVAEGQIRAAHGETPIRLDAAALKETWLLKFHMHRTDQAA
jgi:Gas vesicle synthesis protein GvpL/GvpF